MLISSQAMIMTMKINMSIGLTLCLILFVQSFGSSQTNDFGTWWGVEVRKKLPHNIRIAMESEVRLKENSNQLKNIYITPSIQWEPWGWMKIGLQYRFDNRYNPKGDYFIQQHRLAFDIGFEYPIKRFEITYRNRTQFQWADFYSDKKTYPEMANRNQIGISYKWPNLPLRTIAEAECWIPLERNAWLSRVRTAATQEYSINKMHKLQACFIFQSQLFRSSPLREYILSLKYVLTFN